MNTSTSKVVLGVCFACVAGCDVAPDLDKSGSSGRVEVDEVVPLPLVTAADWRPASTELDPLRHERPLEVECPAAAWGPELGGLEIQTGSCTYFHATQPGLVAIEPGDAVEVLVFHDRLDAAEPAEGHVALLMGDQVVWEQRVDIPADAAVLQGGWVADRAWPAGAEVGLHLHNHGYNAWTLLEVMVVPSPP